jgi:hypothetical protein
LAFWLLGYKRFGVEEGEDEGLLLGTMVHNDEGLGFHLWKALGAGFMATISVPSGGFVDSR